jgi:hypothetical protein
MTDIKKWMGLMTEWHANDPDNPYQPGEGETCPECDGEGVEQDEDGNLTTKECPHCEGTGEVFPEIDNERPDVDYDDYSSGSSYYDHYPMHYNPPRGLGEGLEKALMREYKNFVGEALPNTPQNQQVGAQMTPGSAAAMAQTQAQKPAMAQPAAPETAQPAAPQQPATTQVNPSQPAPGQQPPADPNAVKQTADQLAQVLGNPEDPRNAELQNLLKNAGLMQ